jgi:starch-binding outer membrane protein, SusD/RagB family
MKKLLKPLFLLLIVTVFSSCSDFFKLETDDVLQGDDYISAQTEMYTGYLGIITKMQAVGDKSIYLTDTRGELLEPTPNTPSELISIYNYSDDTTSNGYADPAGYYDVVIACNDYLANMKEYRENYTESVNEDHYKCLVSSTLRVKTWAYLTIAKIYGKALWFDDPLIKMQHLSDTAKFELKDLDGVVAACKNLLVNGFDSIDGTLTFSWYEWLDPETNLADSQYRYWDYMTPDYAGLWAELCLWSGDYQEAATTMFNALNEKISSSTSDATPWIRNTTLNGNYKTIWNNTDPYPREVVSAIIYSYTKNQTNSLLKHFGTEYPNQYLLRPSEVGRNRFDDNDFNPKGSATSDTRTGVTFKTDSEGRYYIAKFRPDNSKRTYAYQDDVHIYIYRASEYHFMLAEALNHLGRFEEAAALINGGVGGRFPTGGVTWAGFTDDWTGSTALGTRKYYNVGIRGTFSLGNRTFTTSASPEVLDTVKKFNDKAIMDEMMLEFPCEGKIYPSLIRVAKRWNDYNIVADRVCPKYGDKAEEIRAKILAGRYFVPWDLQLDK